MASIISSGTTSGTALNMTADTSGQLQLATNSGTTAVTIDTSQNVGIGKTPTTKLDVNGSLNVASGMTMATANWFNFGTDQTFYSDAGYGLIIKAPATSNFIAFRSSNDTERMRIDSSGNLTIGTTDTSNTSGTGIKFLPSNGSSVATMALVGNSSSAGQGSYHLYSTSLSQYQFYVLYNGTIAARSTSITGLSDQSEKTNIKDLETGLNEVLALKPRRFDWINGEGTNIAGFVAQEVEPILPDLIQPYKISDDETKLGLKMGDMLPTLVKAIQEQQTIINDLKARVETLESK